VFRKRWRCKGCGATFGADYEETSEWKNGISPEYRNLVINAWMSGNYRSIRSCSANFGIDDSNLEQWETDLAETFYDIQHIDGYEQLYFGSLSCVHDETKHCVVAETSNGNGGLVGFVKDYSEKGFIDECKRFENREKVRKIRYDYVPGINKALHDTFPEAELAVNRRELRHEFERLLPEYDGVSELSTLLQPDKDITDEKFILPLLRWANGIPDSESGKKQVKKIIMEIKGDICNSRHFAVEKAVVDTIRSVIDKWVGKKASFESIMLHVMYDNDMWRQKVKYAGKRTGFVIHNVVGPIDLYEKEKDFAILEDMDIRGFEITEKALNGLLPE
jgi:hypothetical protein